MFDSMLELSAGVLIPTCEASPCYSALETFKIPPRAVELRKSLLQQSSVNAVAWADFTEEWTSRHQEALLKAFVGIAFVYHAWQVVINLNLLPLPVSMIKKSDRVLAISRNLLSLSPTLT